MQCPTHYCSGGNTCRRPFAIHIILTEIPILSYRPHSPYLRFARILSIRKSRPQKSRIGLQFLYFQLTKHCWWKLHRTPTNPPRFAFRLCFSRHCSSQAARHVFTTALPSMHGLPFDCFCCAAYLLWFACSSWHLSLLAGVTVRDALKFDFKMTRHGIYPSAVAVIRGHAISASRSESWPNELV
jgi:hypothetical protein